MRESEWDLDEEVDGEVDDPEPTTLRGQWKPHANTAEGQRRFASYSTGSAHALYAPAVLRHLPRETVSSTAKQPPECQNSKTIYCQPQPPVNAWFVPLARILTILSSSLSEGGPRRVTATDYFISERFLYS